MSFFLLGVTMMSGLSGMKRRTGDPTVLACQESNFQYLFGVKEPGCFAALHLDYDRGWIQDGASSRVRSSPPLALIQICFFRNYKC